MSWNAREWILPIYAYVVNQQCHKLLQKKKKSVRMKEGSTGSCCMSFERKWRARGDLGRKKVMPYILGVDRNVIELAERYREELGWKSKHWQKGRLSPESFKYTYLLWRRYLQHASILSHAVFSLSVFIQSALFDVVPLNNFFVSFPPSQSFPLPVLFYLVPQCGTLFINACSGMLLKCCTRRRAEYVY